MKISHAINREVFLRMCSGFVRTTASSMPVNQDNEGREVEAALPVIGFAQAVHLLEKSSPKQSAQYGLSSL